MKFEGNVAFFTLNGTWFALYPLEELAADVGVSAKGNGFRGFTLAYNGQSKEEVNQVIAKAEQAGAIIVKQPQDVFWGGYSGYFEDPEDILLGSRLESHFLPWP